MYVCEIPHRTCNDVYQTSVELLILLFLRFALCGEFDVFDSLFICLFIFLQLIEWFNRTYFMLFKRSNCFHIHLVHLVHLVWVREQGSERGRQIESDWYVCTTASFKLAHLKSYAHMLVAFSIIYTHSHNNKRDCRLCAPPQTKFNSVVFYFVFFIRSPCSEYECTNLWVCSMLLFISRWFVCCCCCCFFFEWWVLTITLVLVNQNLFDFWHN